MDDDPGAHMALKAVELAAKQFHDLFVAVLDAREDELTNEATGYVKRPSKPATTQAIGRSAKSP